MFAHIYITKLQWLIFYANSREDDYGFEKHDDRHDKPAGDWL